MTQIREITKNVKRVNTSIDDISQNIVTQQLFQVEVPELVRKNTTRYNYQIYSPCVSQHTVLTYCAQHIMLLSSEL